MPFGPVRSYLVNAWRYAALAGLVAALVVGASVTRPARSAVRSSARTVTAARPHRPTTGADAVRRPLRHHARASRSHRRTGWIRPVAGPVTSGFGPRWGSFHPGIDIGARYGSKVRAIVGGRVLSAGWIPGYGKTVRLRHDGQTFFYPHLSRIHVRHGRVRTGAMLGRVGSTGFSTGPHLHIEIRKNGRARNPRPILRRHGVRL